MHARYPSTSTYSPPPMSPPLTPPYKSRQHHPSSSSVSAFHNPSLFLRRRRNVLALGILLLFLYWNPLHLPLLPRHGRDTISPTRPGSANPALSSKDIKWSRYAYSLYATDQAYLCNAVMVFESLQRLGSRAERVLFYPGAWDDDDDDGGVGSERNSELLQKARDVYAVDTIPVIRSEWEALLGLGEAGDAESARRAAMESKNGVKDAEKKKKRRKGGYENSFMKFLAWSQTGYERVIHLDSDIELVGHLDHLFFLPAEARVAMMRAYWLLDPTLSSSAPSSDGSGKEKRDGKPPQRLPDLRLPLTSLFIVLQPSEREFGRLMRAARAVVQRGEEADWDMEILNRMFGDECLVLPHKGLAVLTGEFRTADHGNYLGSGAEGAGGSGEAGDGKGAKNEVGEGGWNADAIIRDVKIAHFSDWPVNKPWIMWPHQLLPMVMPKCALDPAAKIGSRGKGTKDCANKRVWMGLYDTFRRRRKDVCALLSAPAPEWPPKNGTVEWEWLQEMEGKVKGKGSRAGEKDTAEAPKERQGEDGATEVKVKSKEKRRAEPESDVEADRGDDSV